MYKYFYQTRSGTFYITESGGAFYVEYGKEYIGAFPTSAVAARAVSTGEKWPSNKARPPCAREVPVYLKNWSGMWVQVNRLPEFPPLTERERAEIIARDKELIDGRTAITNKYERELAQLSKTPHFIFYWVLTASAIGALVLFFDSGPHAMAAACFIGASFSLYPAWLIYDDARTKKIFSTEYQALVQARDAERAALEDRFYASIGSTKGDCSTRR